MTSTTTTGATLAPSTSRPAPDRAGVTTLLVLLVLATIGERILGFWHPDPDSGGEFSYRMISGGRDTFWAMHFFGAVAVTVQQVALALLAWLLVRHRAPRWGLAGGLLTSLGGLLFSVGIAAEGVLFAYAGDPGALPAATGAAFLHHVESGGGRYLVGIVPGLVLNALGTLLLAVALWRSRSVPGWLPALFAIGTIAGFAAPFGIVGGVISSLTLAPATLLVGWHARRTTSRPPSD